MIQNRKISTIDEACLFLSDWFGWTGNFEGPSVDPGFELPAAVQTVNHRLGRLWLETPPAKLFTVQDRLIPLQDYAPEPGGVVPIARENQGVWEFGFRPATGAQLWVRGDWPDDLWGSEEWRQAAQTIDTAIIFILLSNAVWSSPVCEMDESDDKPAQADCLLWSFAPLAGFSGFWTDRETSLIRMQGAGWGVTARR